MPKRNNNLTTKYGKKGGKTMDFCAKCKTLHGVRVARIKMGLSPDEKMREIERLADQNCKDLNCDLHPGNLWGQPKGEGKRICAYCYSDPCACEGWVPK